jgi:hypothetical protein
MKFVLSLTGISLTKFNKMLTMKRLIFILIPAIMLVSFVVSCSKSESYNGTQNNSPYLVGTWSGTGQYGTTPGGTTYVFSISFKANGEATIVGNNSTTADNATGTWQIVQDSVHVVYIYSGSSAVYKLSGKYSSGSNVMAGTIGLSPVTAGVGLFTVTKE